MNTYTTSEVAKIIGIHPNTVRMYEEWGLIPLAERKSNGYRVFTDYHIEQLSLDNFLLGKENAYEKRERAEDAIAKLRDKYGYSSVQRGVVLEDAKVNGLDIRGKKEETNSKNNPPMDEV